VKIKSLKEFKDNLRDLRKKHGLSRQQLAKKTGISKTSLSGYEMGTSSPTLPKMCALADYFGVSLDDLSGHEKFKITEIYEILLELLKVYEMVKGLDKNNKKSNYPK
jgi:transcriptional regulator with XRE-family HTH domain